MVSLQQDPEGTPCRNGGGGVCTRLVVGYTWTWASLGFPAELVRMAVNNWSMGGGLGEKVQNTNRGNQEAEFPPPIRGQGLPPKIRVA